MKRLLKIIPATLLALLVITPGASAAEIGSSSSNNIPCASGTTFYKDVSVGGKYTIKLCKIPSLSSSSWWGPSGTPVVNSNVSKLFLDLGNDFKKTTGSTLNVSDAFRPNYAQQYYYDCSHNGRTSFTTDSGKTVTCNANTFYIPASPGTSNHEMGIAIDIEICNNYSNSDCMYQGHNVDTILARNGLGRTLRSRDPVHVNVLNTTVSDNASGYSSSGDSGGTSSTNGGTTPSGSNNSSTNSSYDSTHDVTPENGVADVAEGKCANILPGDWCGDDDGIMSVISMFLSILTGAVVVAGTIGIIICGFLWMTARDNEAQVAKAKRRMLEIMIGIVAWVLLALIGNLFIPKSSTDIDSDVSYVETKSM